MKEVLFIIEGLFGGGAERALVELLKHIDYAQYNVTLGVVFAGGVYTKEIPSQVRLFHIFSGNETPLESSLRRKALRYCKKYGNTWLIKFLFWQKCKQHHFDTIISFIEGYPILFHSTICKWAKLNISWVHCDLYHQHWTTAYYHSDYDEKRCYEKMNKIVFVSRNSMKYFDYLYKTSNAKTCLYNIVDADNIRKLAKEKVVMHDQFTITSIGSLYKVKGYDRLIRVAKLFKDKGYALRFQILGQGEEYESLLQMRDELGLQNDVAFLGFEENPYPYLKQSDIFVRTSLSEGLSYVICEALVLGIPVVATKTSGGMELLEDGKYGILAEHDDASIYGAIKQLVDSDVLYKEYQAKSLSRAKIFNIEDTMAQFYDII